MTHPPYDELSFLHFNDVPRAPLRHSAPSVFSGDAFSPSLESAVVKGEHMVPVLNHLLVDVACYGNHDFDFGEDALVELSQGCTFPWLLENAVHSDGRLIASAKEHLVLERKGYKIGFLGLAGTDWPSNCQHLPADIAFLDPVSVARRISSALRSVHGADIVIAMTHMRHEEDVYLAESCDKELDLILGGHDHDLAVHGSSLSITDRTFEGHIKIVKSGMDFKSFSDIKVWLARNIDDGKAFIGRIRVNQTRDITSEDDLPDDNTIRNVLTTLQKRIADIVDEPLFCSTVPLDGRTATVRTGETNFGNMLADAVRAYHNADVAFVNSGSLRCDRIIPAGVITAKDMIDALPFANPFVVKRLRGQMIAEALENAVCDIVDGRFLQVSGLAFAIDPQCPVGSRIHDLYLVPDHKHWHAPRSCAGAGIQPTAPPRPRPDSDESRSSGRSSTHRLAATPLDAEQEYTVCMAAFIAAGFDGYALFRDAPTVIDEEGATVTDSSLLLQVSRRDDHCGCYRAADDGAKDTRGPNEMDDVGAVYGYGKKVSEEGQEREGEGSVDRARAAIVLGRAADGVA